MRDQTEGKACWRLPESICEGENIPPALEACQIPNKLTMQA